MNLAATDETNSKKYNILFVCPSINWGTRERQVLANVLLAQEQGFDAYLYCLKDSFLDIKASKQGVKVLHHRGKLSSRVLKWQKFINLKRVFSSIKFDLVHCYDLNSLWPLGFLLRGNSLVPLVVSLNLEIKKSYRQFWYKALAARADLFIIPASELEGGLTAHLNLPARKMECLPLGIQVDNVSKNALLARERKSRIIGSYIGPHEKDASFLLPILHTINILNLKAGENDFCNLYLFSEDDCKATTFYPELSRMILDMGLEERVSFLTFDKFNEPFIQVDLWVGLNQREFVHDFSLGALVHGLPVVVPRNSFSREVLGIGEVLGESYKLGDARELREKCEKVLSMRQEYRHNLKRASIVLGERFSLLHYKNQLFRTYQKLLDRRLRLHRKRRL
jgi:glycosyltransferase involved in cell wall biosynthesis